MSVRLFRKYADRFCLDFQNKFYNIESFSRIKNVTQASCRLSCRHLADTFVAEEATRRMRVGQPAGCLRYSFFFLSKLG